MKLEDIVDQIKENLVIKVLINEQNMNVIIFKENILVYSNCQLCISIYYSEDRYFVSALNLTYREKIYELYRVQNLLVLYNFHDLLDMIDKIF
ncbi:hypothetical protein D3C87_81260 [compost metagenome]